MDADWSLVTERQGKDYLDFSVNTNPLGAPPDIVRCCEAFVSAFEYYPDPECQALRKGLSLKYAVPADFIYCGSGADDLIYRLLFSLQPGKALILEPTFEEYGRALALTGCEIQRFQLRAEQDFQLDTEGLLSAIEHTDILFICNPNNPMGRLIQPGDMLRLLKKCEDEQVVCVVDECFIEMLRDWRRHTAKQACMRYRNLVVIDAFTKTFAIPGLRLGFTVTQNKELLRGMQRSGQQFNVSTPAQQAGLMALSDTPYMEKTYGLIEEERRWLMDCFDELGIRTYPAAANFILAKAPAANFNQRLLELGVKVRDCSNIFGLSNEYCRFAVRRHEENAVLAAVLKNMKRNGAW
jgi:threonine-phosphate decarboxylase